MRNILGLRSLQLILAGKPNGECKGSFLNSLFLRQAVPFKPLTMKLPDPTRRHTPCMLERKTALMLPSCRIDSSSL